MTKHLSRATLLSTPRGPVRCVHLQGVEAHCIGFPPTAWEWTPWEYATDGRFTGRWDDPDGVWRTLYVGAPRLSCYLKVHAYARPCPELAAELDGIDVDEEDDEFPTIAPRVGAAVVGHTTSRGQRFDHRLVCPPRRRRDPGDAACRVPRGRSAARTRRPRRYSPPRRPAPRVNAGDLAVDQQPHCPGWVRSGGGIEFDSRHGDRLTLWAVHEWPGDNSISSNVTPPEYGPVDPTDPDLIEAMRLLDLVWTDD